MTAPNCTALSNLISKAPDDNELNDLGNFARETDQNVLDLSIARNRVIPMESVSSKGIVSILPNESEGEHGIKTDVW